ncbi:DUF4817 domain-containing protein [Trichonephila clavipes]|nr:DUF4817 domain-containing protein [Trichonephila clavipes]
MAVTLPERAFACRSCFMKAKEMLQLLFGSFIDLKIYAKGPLLPQALKRMIARFEKTGHLGVQPGRGRKSTRSDVVEDVATAIVDQSMDNVIGCSSARAVSRHFGCSLQHSVECTDKSGAFFPVQNSSQSAVDGQRQGEATELCIDIPG